jgi:hypothetical protein
MKTCVSIIFNAIFLLITITSFSQTDFQNYKVVPTLTTMINNSTLVVEGSVIDTKGFKNEKGNIFTSATVKVSKIFKGDVTDSTIQVVIEGGEVDDLIVIVSHGTILSKETNGIFFLTSNKTDSSLNKDSVTYLMVWGNYSCIRYNNNPYFPRAKYDGIGYNDFEKDLYPTIEGVTGTPVKVISSNLFEVEATKK